MHRNKPTHTPECGSHLLAMGLKECNKCRQVLPLDSFHVNAKDPSGRVGMCKPCRREYRIGLRGKILAEEDEKARLIEKARLLYMDFNELTTDEWLSLSPEDMGLSPEVWRKMYLRKVDEKTVGRLVKGRCQRLRATGERFLKQSEEWA